ncbi:MAG: L-lactate permease [Verrucomicrobiales bacterium]
MLPPVNLIAAAFPVVWLIWIMTKRNPWPSHLALPVAALLALFVRIGYFHDPAREWGSAVATGWLLAWTPILIIGGAVFFFKAMETSGAMEIIRQWLNAVTPSPVARLLIIGWAFQYLIEGASGFGTPAALAGPLLVGLGFPALRVAAFCLILDSVPVSFGAVGTPIWFGLGQVPLSPEALTEVGVKTALLNGVAGLVVVPIALRLLVDWRTIRRHTLFISLAILSCEIPSWLVSHESSEFPSVIGGMVGLLTIVLMARFHFALPAPDDDALAIRSTKTTSMPPLRHLIAGLLPLILTVFILLATRIRQLGLKSWLQGVDPAWELNMDWAGQLRVSTSLVFEWRNILGSESTWTHPLLYVPSLIPFLLVGAITLGFANVSRAEKRRAWRETFQRLKNPTIALFGALIFVRLLMCGGHEASSMILGHELAALTGPFWSWTSVYLGSLGAFFAGSATISNLTFGAIQFAIAENLDLNPTVILALQATGSSSGNMIAIHNIVAVSSILGIKNQEGAILKLTVVPMLLYGILASIAAALFW